MRRELRTLGASRSRVIVIDDFSGRRDDIVAIASAMAPFPARPGNAYPGLRRIITDQDSAAYAHVQQTLRDAARYICGTFDIHRFSLDEASFSMVTATPDGLGPMQRVPHFDRTEPKYLAILHYLCNTPQTGTAFYRHRATGLETIRPGDADAFAAIARRELENLPAETGYIAGSTELYEQIGFVEAKPDRLVVYQGCLLHSGLIPPGMTFSDDPAVGRLTANLFIQGW